MTRIATRIQRAARRAVSSLFTLGPIAVMCLAPAASWGQVQGAEGKGLPTTASEFDQRVSRISDFLREFVDTSAVPGVSIALGVGERFTHVEAFGYADLESRRPATPHTRYRIGSVSKTLTAAALGRMVEDRIIDLDATVQTYVPEFPEKTHPITLRELATHTAGIRHYRGDEALSNRTFSSVLDALSVFANDPLVAEPGTAFAYSTYGYVLLSAAMERAAGVPFLELMKTRVLDPLDMAETGPELKGQLPPEEATGYELDAKGRPEEAPETDLSNKWAGGGYVSTAGDVLRFARAHLNGFLRSETPELLWTPGTTSDGKKTPMGIGWQPAEIPGQGRMLVAGGDAIGGTTVIFVIPKTEVVVVFMTNMGHAPIRGVPLRILRTLLGAEGGG